MGRGLSDPLLIHLKRASSFRGIKQVSRRPRIEAFHKRLLIRHPDVIPESAMITAIPLVSGLTSGGCRLEADIDPHREVEEPHTLRVKQADRVDDQDASRIQRLFSSKSPQGPVVPSKARGLPVSERNQHLSGQAFPVDAIPLARPSM